MKKGVVKMPSELGEEKLVSFRKLVDIPSTTYATFGLYRYPAKFIPHVISYVLEEYDLSGKSVIDPFAGYGTVGVVARLYGCPHELWDLNPLIELFYSAATLKLKDVDLPSLIKNMTTGTNMFVPDWPNIEYWFPQTFLPFMYKVWGFYHSLEDSYVKTLITIPLLKTTRYFSYDDPQRQKLSKSPYSIKRIEALEKGEWKTRFLSIFEGETLKVLQGLKEYMKLDPKPVSSVVKGGVDALTMKMNHDTDVLITSPPYLQSQEYIRQAKMDLFWCGYSNEYIKQLKRLEIPYRDVQPIILFSNTYRRVKESIKEVPSKVLLDRYLWGVLGALTKIQNHINEYMFIFLGRASMRGMSVPLDKIFAEHFSELGWIHEHTLVDQIAARRLFKYKVNPASGLNDSRTKTENLVVLRRRR
jgi:hypothetical protein